MRRLPTVRWNAARGFTPMLGALAAMLVALASLGPLLGPGTALAAPAHPVAGRPPGGNFADPVVRQVDIAQPAVVRIGTSEHVTVDVRLCTRSVTLPPTGGSYSLGVTGSGTFVSANGDILTADHVVEPPNEFIAELAAQDIADVFNNAPALDPGCQFQEVDATDVANGLGYERLTPHVSGRKSFVWMGTAFSGSLSYSKLSEVPVQDATVVANSSYTQDDVAVIHVNLTDTPSVQLDNSTAVAVEDRLTVIGFPGNGDVNGDPNNFLTSSVNDVLVSSIKTGDNGSPLIQVGGNVEHGDSGGPAIDSAGHIVGIVSFGGPDPGSTSFLRASNNAQALMQNHGVVTAAGAFQQKWSQAFADYAAGYAGHWHKAAQEMAALAATYPAFLGLTPYLGYARTAAANEALPSSRASGPGTILVVVVAAGVLALLLGGGAGILYFYLRARRRQRARSAPLSDARPPYAGYALPMPMPPYGGTYPPSYGPPGGYGPPTGYPPPTPGYGPSAAAPPYGDGAGASGSGSGAAAGASMEMGACVNGHTLAPGQLMCPWCGAPRVYQSVPAAVQAARLPTQDR